MAADQCYGPRAELIGLLIDRDYKSLQNSSRSPPTFLDRFSNAGRSVYMEQEATIASLAKKYANRTASKSQGAGATKQTQGDAPARPAARPKDAPQAKVKASTEPNGDRGTDKPGSNADSRGGLDEREQLRLQRKLEEAAAKKKPEEAKAPATVVEDTRRTEDRAGIAGRHDDNLMNTRMKRSVTMNFDSKSEQERAREEKEREEKAKEASKAREEKAREERARIKRAGKSSSKSNLNNSKNLAERLTNSDALLLRLKLHYMRTRSAEMVISFLYGNNINGEFPFILFLCLSVLFSSVLFHRGFLFLLLFFPCSSFLLISFVSVSVSVSVSPILEP